MPQIPQYVLTFIDKYAKKMVFIIILFFLGKYLLHIIANRIVKTVSDDDESTKTAREKRAETLQQAVVAAGKVVIYTIIILMILRLAGIDIGPILATAGILGVAIGFGSQTLVKDFVSGLFILVENQYSVGDKVKVSGVEGIVVKITMRSTILRGDDGKRHYFSNGSIGNIANFSQNKAHDAKNN